MKIRKVLYLLLTVVCAAENAWAANTGNLAETIYHHAHFRNRRALAQMVRNGHSLDTIDDRGNTALCMAMIHKDEKAYRLLRQMGANTSHSCVKRLEAAVRPVQNDKFVWNVGPTTYLGAAALIGGTVAIAAGSGGGGSKGNNDIGSGNEGGNQGDNQGDNQGGNQGGNEGDNQGDVESGHNVEPVYFQTEEYKQGHFLPQIGAADAYARFYTETDKGELISSLEPVAVGVVDSGVYGAHKEFADTDIGGVNYDYGPCSKSGNTTNCWQWAKKYEVDGQTLRNVTYLKLDSGHIYITRIGKTGSKEEYDKWASAYEEGYDWTEKKDSETSFYPNNTSDAAHGTHVAGIIAADRNGAGMHGVAFENAQIIAARWDLMSSVYAPVKDVIDMGAKVINFSLGIDSTPETNATSIQNYVPQLEDYIDSVRYQVEKNVVFVFAAGNEGQSQPGLLNGLPLLPEFKDSLKDLFVTVVALDKDNKLADYSNACGVAQNYCIAAPGTDIWSTVNKEDTLGMMSGTSMAAPVVTGSIAFLMGAYPYMQPQEVVKLIFETADDLGDVGVDAVYGNGLINLAKASLPQGEMELPADGNVQGQSVSVRSTAMTVPSVFKSALTEKMKRSVVALDKYKRPYALPMSSFVKMTHGGVRHFKNDLYAFSRYQPKRQVAINRQLAFSFAPAVLADSPSGIGTVSAEYAQAEHTTGFYYTENTLYNHETYFDKALSNPFMAMNSAYGFYRRYRPATDWSVEMGFSTGENGLYDGSRENNDRDFDNRVYGFDTEATYNVTDQLSLTAMSGLLYEDGALLGMNGTGGFNIGDSNTYYTGLAVKWSPMKNLFFSGAYYQGWTDAGGFASNLMQVDRLVSDSFAVDGHYRYNQTDVIGLQISSPLRIGRGKLKFDLPVGRDNYSDAVYRERFSASLKPDSREYKFSLYNDRVISDDMNFKLQFDMRLNPDHQKNAETDYRMMLGFNWTFN